MTGYERLDEVVSPRALPTHDIFGGNQDATIAGLSAANAARKAIGYVPRVVFALVLAVLAVVADFHVAGSLTQPAWVVEFAAPLRVTNSPLRSG
ncbi:MAG: hypothetical protein QM778_00800 [Myxococcales bacterium]